MARFWRGARLGLDREAPLRDTLSRSDHGSLHPQIRLRGKAHSAFHVAQKPTSIQITVFVGKVRGRSWHSPLLVPGAA
jgi:hypothetical protein